MRPIFNKSEAKRENKKLYEVIKDFPFKHPDGNGFRATNLFVIDGKIRKSTKLSCRDVEYDMDYMINEFTSIIGTLVDGLVKIERKDWYKFSLQDDFIVLDINSYTTDRYVVPIEKKELFEDFLEEVIKGVESIKDEDDMPFTTARIHLFNKSDTISLLVDLLLEIRQF